MRHSPHSTVLGATGRAPDVDTLTSRLTEMRQTTVPALAQQKDVGDQKRVARLHGQAATAKENASMHRSVADDARTEKALRQRIAQEHPTLHQSETRARAEVQQVQQTQQAQAARIEQQTRRYQPPAPSRSGPSQGR
ncbi:hypothetical protein ACFYT5_03180 [Streptomyces anulatus]|uniref:hypothetical protein n=1 Tax=Streptomyces anulatus TaxID=1892 RepID=UPI00067C74C7|nr:hypothetical protein [Streptomyces anulatus]KND25909.1 hypothetical protein IQ60_29920 [Streptomyces europaeiscabiei]WSR80189.1 hypothetical protein OG274_35185 [Streptomyces anulatus]GGY76660.1 hypothetical protein GCM10010342_75630 [Streptomyces anulatus]